MIIKMPLREILLHGVIALREVWASEIKRVVLEREPVSLDEATLILISCVI